MITASQYPDLNSVHDTIICFSHLRWDFVFQRPQHILTRLANHTRVFYIEEPVFDEGYPRYVASDRTQGVTVLVPHVPHGTCTEGVVAIQKMLLDDLLIAGNINNPVLWYYTPVALAFSRHLHSSVTVFDCMDELSAFRFAPADLPQLESELMQKAGVMFTGGASLYDAKKSQHSNIHLFPSSIDQAHFSQARNGIEEPADQASLPYPRLGFFGVIDERFDAVLLDKLAAAQPDWQFVLIGPVVKIDPATLPQHANIHYLGKRAYEELPAYISGWDIAMIPFAINESTRFISPTKTPEYLAAGKPVISSPIVDVVRPYGEQELVHIASGHEEWIGKAAQILGATDDTWLREADKFLAGNSWNATVNEMWRLVNDSAAGTRIPIPSVETNKKVPA